jgi:hypothetical protein
VTAAERLRALADLERREQREGWEDFKCACLAGADALDRLAQNCGNCRHSDVDDVMGGWTFCDAPARTSDDRWQFPLSQRLVPLDERCKGWTKREDA